MVPPSHAQAKKLLEAVAEIKGVPPVVLHYWRHQFLIGWYELLPFLMNHGAFHPGMAVIEIGCGEAGVLSAFTVAGATEAAGTDIEKPRLEAAASIATALRLPLYLTLHDILRDEIPSQWHARFDLVLLRDVIEHLEDTAAALVRIAKLLRPNGHLMVVFPPYPSPFGGHQHLSVNRLMKIPYIHLLPDKLFYYVFRGDFLVERSEVLWLRRIRLSLPKFLRAVRSSEFEIVAQRHYLIRPAFRYRLKLPFPSVPLTALVRLLPSLMQYFCTEAGYLLRKSSK
ncbi:MAG: methyltransferase domain-containing protein [Bacteroidia bacterium]|nr:class I SAM-dependent methyltransferase [Bacteroidia bacterium]MDW8015705.1 methyltransferase domain-containing protein [Bacteroidia bacterium]